MSDHEEFFRSIGDKTAYQQVELAKDYVVANPGAADCRAFTLWCIQPYITRALMDPWKPDLESVPTQPTITPEVTMTKAAPKPKTFNKKLTQRHREQIAERLAREALSQMEKISGLPDDIDDMTAQAEQIIIDKLITPQQKALKALPAYMTKTLERIHVSRLALPQDVINPNWDSRHNVARFYSSNLEDLGLLWVKSHFEVEREELELNEQELEQFEALATRKEVLSRRIDAERMKHREAGRNLARELYEELDKVGRVQDALDQWPEARETILEITYPEEKHGEMTKPLQAIVGQYFQTALEDHSRVHSDE